MIKQKNHCHLLWLIIKSFPINYFKVPPQKLNKFVLWPHCSTSFASPPSLTSPSLPSSSGTISSEKNGLETKCLFTLVWMAASEEVFASRIILIIIIATLIIISISTTFITIINTIAIIIIITLVWTAASGEAFASMNLYCHCHHDSFDNIKVRGFDVLWQWLPQRYGAW